jgi:hypothetical protein
MSRRPGRGPYLLGLERVPDRWGTGFRHRQVDARRGDRGGHGLRGAAGGGQLERLGELPAVPRAVLGGGWAPERYLRAALEPE